MSAPSPLSQPAPTQMQYKVTRGDYANSSDNNSNGWYIEPVNGPVNRVGRGYRTRSEAVQALTEMQYFAGRDCA